MKKEISPQAAAVLIVVIATVIIAVCWKLFLAETKIPADQMPPAPPIVPSFDRPAGPASPSKAPVEGEVKKN
ncbi:MAG TPA: hypothetical protein VNJ09_03900 [Chthonomonadales bacterium]|nr:hypothetical protein [Chthonomonadales bacterium]